MTKTPKDRPPLDLLDLAGAVLVGECVGGCGLAHAPGDIYCSSGCRDAVEANRRDREEEWLTRWSV